MKMNWDYIAGFTDGEGCLSIKKRKGRKPRCHIVLSQKYGLALDEIVAFLNEQGVKAYILYSPSDQKRELKRLQIADLRSVKTFLEAIKDRVIVKVPAVKRGLALDYDPKWTDLTETEITRAVELRRQGLTYRQIGAELKRDDSWIFKVLKKRMGSQET